MIKRQMRVVSKTDCYGRQCFCGITAVETEVVGLQSFIVDVLDMEDESGYWVLGWPDQILSLSESDITTIINGEERRIAVGKLSDAECTALGVTR